MTSTVSKMENVAPITFASWTEDRVCFKCKYVDTKTGNCSVNPAKVDFKGDGYVCDLFKLDRAMAKWNGRDRA